MAIPEKLAGTDLPRTFWLGMIAHEWPVHVFVTEGQVIDWLAAVEGTTLKPRRVWEFDKGVLSREVRVVVVPSKLETVTEYP